MIDGKMIDVPQEESTEVASAGDPTKTDYRMHAAQIQNLMDAIEGKDVLRISAEDGYRAVKLINDVYRTSEQLD